MKEIEWQIGNLGFTLFFIYAASLVVFWLCPPSFHPLSRLFFCRKQDVNVNAKVDEEAEDMSMLFCVVNFEQGL